MNPEVAELGIVGVALIVVWKIADVFKTIYLEKKSNGNGSAVNGASFDRMCLAKDPKHFERIRDVHANMNSVKKSIDDMDTSIAQGKFFCHWEDRDEIRDLKDGITQLVATIEVLTKELRKRPV